MILILTDANKEDLLRRLDLSHVVLLDLSLILCASGRKFNHHGLQPTTKKFLRYLKS